MGRERGHFRDEFKQEAIALLAGSGWRLVRDCRRAGGLALDAAATGAIAREDSMRGRRCPRNRRRPCLALRTRRQRSPGLAARITARAWSATFQERLWRSSRGSAEMRFRLIEDQRDVWPVRVLCDALGVSPSGYIRLAITAREPARDRQSRTAERYPAGSCRAPGPIWGAAYPCRAACRGPECQPQADRAGDAPAWHPGSRAASLSWARRAPRRYRNDGNG